MLSLSNIKKVYKTGDNVVNALDGVSLSFRENEFVSILGPSGGGKTTLLNIIGGLDRYTSGDLVIGGKTTKKFSSRDWDTYRNHSVGFIFQSYNLIPHQTVLSNVELALTLSGVSKKERRKRAIDALVKVGLGDQLRKKPNQMSGGQMQRVAIARALVNNPDILLADEPTGALDSATSLQIMALLKEIAADRLVVMVTHNPELAETYSTRIIKIQDGKIVGDSDPYTPEGEEVKKEGAKKHTSMSFLTALSLSLKNLMTKKGRTILTSFAGSIGIVGIALILALSTGINAYIESVEEDTLSSYPLTIETSTVDLSSSLQELMNATKIEGERDPDKIYSNDVMSKMMKSTISSSVQNNLTDFKKFLDGNKSNIREYTTDIKYRYSTPLNIYKANMENGIDKVSPDTAFTDIGMDSQSTSSSSMMGSSMSMMQSMMSVWKELVGSNELLKEQYTVLKGRLPEAYNEAVIIVTPNNEISDFTLYSLGIKDPQELVDMMKEFQETGEISFEPTQTEYTYDDLLSLSYKMLANTDYFEKQNGVWVDRSDDDIYVTQKLKDAEEIKIVGILRPNSDALANAEAGSIGYTRELMEKFVEKVNDSEIVKEQLANKEVDVFTGLKFSNGEKLSFSNTQELSAFIETLPEPQKSQAAASLTQMAQSGMSEQAILSAFASGLSQNSDATLDSRLDEIGYASLETPSIIEIYSKDFEAKDYIEDIIHDYNEDVKEETDKITYTDYIGLMMSSVTAIINAISYILIAFVAISLVVSSIMIGIITYISVLERTREIGILRAIGASKKDIARVFNAETLIVGFLAGAFGIGLTLLCILPVNAILHAVTDISASAFLPPLAAIILIGVSMLLTFIAGLFPSKVAANKDPVVALRTE